jgi:hypothetical protein
MKQEAETMNTVAYPPNPIIQDIFQAVLRFLMIFLSTSQQILAEVS